MEALTLHRDFGSTGLRVSALGFGAGHIGSPDMSEAAAGTLLNRALDLGVTLIDTARGYGLSEARIGRHLSWRRHEVVISTKIGYSIPGYADWTPEIVEAGVYEALRLMQTDYLDIVHFHSCPKETLMQDALIDALQRQVTAGKVRVAAYSGDNEALGYALKSGGFGSLEFSLNLTDQRPIDAVLPETQTRGLGVIAKRPIANAAWRFQERPVGDYAEVYWERLQAMGIEDLLEQYSLTPLELALRFTTFLPGVHSAIVGTSKPENLEANIALVNRGALPDALIAALRERFRLHDRDWVGQV